MRHKQESTAMFDCIFEQRPSGTRNAPRKTAAGNRIGWMIIAIGLCGGGFGLPRRAISRASTGR
ncbi:hypothetical protein SAMN05444158_1959 [Bradyrhizobium canariense]|uniref:Uncharacterized protein n=1 Tax=Bradyrhizobium canariense TaxID=255045 RepID=A0A1H1RXT0_9BRAD|nr:hypothetical protein SAMN05444158_1959 [Bradyrhizobium canariense]